MEVSWNGGTPNWMVYLRLFHGKSLKKMDDWGYPHDVAGDVLTCWSSRSVNKRPPIAIASRRDHLGYPFSRSGDTLYWNMKNGWTFEWENHGKSRCEWMFQWEITGKPGGEFRWISWGSIFDVLRYRHLTSRQLVIFSSGDMGTWLDTSPDDFPKKPSGRLT